jgi:hypothetical protein
VRFLDWKAMDRAVRLGYDQTLEALDEPAFRERLDAILKPPVEPALTRQPA